VKKADMEVPMGLLRTNEIPPNPYGQPEKFREHMSGHATTALVAEELELPGEACYKLLKDSEGTYFWDGSRLYRLILFESNKLSFKDIETGALGMATIFGHATLVRLKAEHKSHNRK
jgi:hypothetical protein